MRIVPISMSLRTRLLLACTLVQVMMLALLIVNGIRVVDDKLNERTQIHLEEQKQLLNAALSSPLAGRQYRTLAEILERVRADSGIVYLVLFDHNEKLVASAGWERGLPLPPLEAATKASFSGQAEHFHTAMDIEASGIKVGRLHFGLSTAFNSSRATRMNAVESPKCSRPTLMPLDSMSMAV